MGKKRKYRINYFKLIRAIVVLILFIYLIVLGIKGIVHAIKSINEPKVEASTSAKVNANENKIENASTQTEDTRITLTAIGDVMCHESNYKAAYNSKTKEYDFEPSFKNISHYIINSDIAIGNLETTFAGEEKGYSGYPLFNSPKELGMALKNIGIDILSTANNHCMDKGEKGAINTLDTLDEIGISHIGTNRSKEEQDTVLIKEVKGIKIAFLSFTYGTNGVEIPSSKKYLVNITSESLILEQIKLAKKQSPDVICVSMHWGTEYSQKQNKNQEKWADFLFENGVDIIIGNHAHVIQPMEKRKIKLDGGTEKDGFVAYALGNFISNQYMENTQSTVILNIKITKNGESGKISIDDINYVPVYVANNGENVTPKYELIDIEKAIEDYDNNLENKVSKKVYNTIKKELENIKKILSK